MNQTAVDILCYIGLFFSIYNAIKLNNVTWILNAAVIVYFSRIKNELMLLMFIMVTPYLLFKSFIKN